MIGRKKAGNYAFIDSQNLNISVQNYGWKMNWRKFREFLAKRYGVTKAYMFIGYVPENEDLYEQMHQAGYAVVLKQIYDMTRPRSNNNGSDEHKKPIKGNVDADLVLWAMKELPNYDKAIIVSGDGDFHGLIEYLVSKNKLHKVLTPTGHYSSLFHQFQKYIERIDDHRRELAYYDKRTKKTPAPAAKGQA
jgi:uncharacterized LabA/DUF88 family protein